MHFAVLHAQKIVFRFQVNATVHKIGLNITRVVRICPPAYLGRSFHSLSDPSRCELVRHLPGGDYGLRSPGDEWNLPSIQGILKG